MHRNKISFLVLFLAVLTAAQVPSIGLSAYYPFNSNANDSTGNHSNDGKMFVTNPIVFVEDRTGKGLACNFDGVDDYILVPNRSSFNLPHDSATFSVWYKADGCTKIGPGPQCLWDSYELSNTGMRREISLYISPLKDSGGISHRLLEVITIASNNTDTELIVLPSTVNNQGWHNVAVIWEKPTLKLFVDGVLENVQTATLTGAKLSTNNRTTYFGADLWTAKKCYCGVMDDIRLYNRVLSDSEISVLSEEGTGIAIQPERHQIPGGAIAVRKNRNHTGAIPEFTFSISAPITTLAIYDINGRCMTHPACVMFSSRLSIFQWDGSTATGRIAAAGVYYVKATSLEKRTCGTSIILTK
jgi:hypothetical protein